MGQTATPCCLSSTTALLELILEQALDGLRASSWLESSPSSDGPYPPINVFRNGDDFLISSSLG